MKKRIKNKLHKKYISDVVYDVSTSSYWRKRIFETNESHQINKIEITDISDDLIIVINRYDLQYRVFKVPFSEAVGWEDWDRDLVYFRFEAVCEPPICLFSANNPNII